MADMRKNMAYPTTYILTSTNSDIYRILADLKKLVFFLPINQLIKNQTHCSSQAFNSVLFHRHRAEPTMKQQSVPT